MRSPETIIELTKNPLHHLASASSTSVMATSSSNSTARSRRKKVCKCGETPVLSTSWTDDNPSRRFFGCVNYYDGQPCNYFRWLDDEICDRGKIIIPQLRNENLKMKEDFLGMKEELLKMKEELLNLGEQNMSLVAENRKLADDELELKVQQVEMNNDYLKLMDEKQKLHSNLKMIAGRGKLLYVTLVWAFVATAIAVYLYVTRGYGNVCQVGLRGLPPK